MHFDIIKPMKTYPIKDVDKKRLMGRNVPEGICDDGAVRLFWAGSALEICVKATEVWARISSNYIDQEIWLAVEINGYQTARFIAPKKASYVCIAHNLNPEKENLISIIKDTQPIPGDSLHELKIDAIALNDAGEFVPVKPHKIKIEFIGDSLTSGEGLAGKSDEMDWISQWFCGSKTYAAQIAKMLDADWSTVSQCGWGLSWGWDGDVSCSIPLYYGQVCGVLKSDSQMLHGTCNDYNFHGGSDFVVLNLGTNDNSGFSCHDDGKGADGAAGKVIVSDVMKFLAEIRRLNPKAKIIWTWGMMKLNIVPALIKKGIEEYKKQSGDSFIYTLELESMDQIEKTEEDKGSRGHPGLITHRHAANRIADLIRKLSV